MEYSFGGKTFTLKKNTFYLEELAKDVLKGAGVNEGVQGELIELKVKYEALSKRLEFESENTDKIIEDILSVTRRMNEIGAALEWYSNFETSKKIIELLTDGDYSVLTKETIGKHDAAGVWADFFTEPSKK